jgi:ferrous iron transport protein B
VEEKRSYVQFTDKTSLKIALVGNPNSGKSTLFNALTGLNQRTGNFPGVTVDKKSGTARLTPALSAEIIDLPGTYSLYPKSPDERVAFEVLCDPQNEDHPQLTIIVADASNLKRNLFLVSQVIDLKIPVILVLNMMDLVEKDGIVIDTARLSEKLGVRVIPVSARNREGIEQLKKAILEPVPVPHHDIFDARKAGGELVDKVRVISGLHSNFAAFQIINNYPEIRLGSLSPEKKETLLQLLSSAGISTEKLQAQESLERFRVTNRIVDECVVSKSAVTRKSFTQKLDGLLTHRIWGYAIFLLILFLIFQAIFFLAAYPMDWIESLFVAISSWAENVLPPGRMTDLFVNGILAGLSGVVVFVPQIALLFTFIAILEDTGYMARVSFIMDKLMRKFGLNGRSVIPLISGVACAVPAIMSARTISNHKERLITILVTPLMSCSARLPVYTLLISLVVPDDASKGFFNYQGLILMSLYLIGFLAAIGAALVLKWILKAKERSYFIMELPVYRAPQWRTVLLTIYEKVKIFLWDAGKVIVAISMILWYLTSYAPGDRHAIIEARYEEKKLLDTTDTRTFAEIDAEMKAAKLESSYAGIVGKAIEPAIAPLGFDWKMGISLVTSFAAREVFVGTMATIYSAGDEDNTEPIRDKMRSEINPRTGLPAFSIAVCFSLMVFYAFAMQCMSTLAVVYRETRHWQWPVIQFLFMGALAWISSFIVYQLLS